MSTPAQKDSERSSSRQRGSSECKALIDAATKDLFRRNAFRITGLSVDATTPEVARHTDKLKMLAELGQDQPTQSAAFPMKPPPSLDEIRDAIRNLKDPQKRMVDEFFWFWPQEFGNSHSDPAMQALARGDSKTATEIWAARETGAVSSTTAKHNLALVHHVHALDWENDSVKNALEAERRQKITDCWKSAFNRWETLATNEQFWEQVVARIRQLNEPNLPTGFARRMRATLPEALYKINAELAVAFAESGKIELARLHIQFMRETNQGLDSFEKTAELVLTPARNRLKEQVQQAKHRADENPQEGAAAARELLTQVRKTLDLFDLFFGKESDVRNELFDEIAAVCNRLQVVYYKETGDDTTCLEILKVILPFATSADLRQAIQKDISETCARLALFAATEKREPVYTLLTSIQDSKESPSVRLARFKRDAVAAIVTATEDCDYLSAQSADFKDLFESAAIVLRGISLDAWNNHHDRQTAVAANELAARHATSPELKQRLAEDRETLQQTRYEADITPIESAPSLSTINGIGFKLYGSTDADPTTGSYLSTYYFVFLFIPVFPICRYRVTSIGDSYRFFGKAPLRTFDKLHLALCIIGLITVLMIGLVPSSESPPSPSPRSSYAPPSTPAAPSVTLDASPISPTATSKPTYRIKPMYRIPRSVSAELDSAKQQISIEKAKSDALDTRLATAKQRVQAQKSQADALQSRLETLGRQIDLDRINLDPTIESDLDEFNDKVNIYNTLLQSVRAASATANNLVDAYNTLLEEAQAQDRVVNQLVDNYNAKLQQYGR